MPARVRTGGEVGIPSGHAAQPPGGSAGSEKPPVKAKVWPPSSDR
jgi:hypothetical protein